MKCRLPGPQGAGAGGQASADVGTLAPGGEGRRLFVAHVDPLDLAAMDGVGDMVEGVADDAIAMADAGGFQGFPTTISATFLLDMKLSSNGIR